MASGNTELERLIAGCINDELHLKEALYKSFYGYLKGVVIRYVQDYHSAEELVNDSFVKIFSHLENFKGTKNAADLNQSFKSWIAKIASRTAIDFLRRKKIDLGTDEINNNHVPARLTVNPANYNDGREIMNLLNLLPPTQKTVFNLYELEGFSHEEIASLLAIPENACRVYLSRAKAKLKTLLVKNNYITRS